MSLNNSSAIFSGFLALSALAVGCNSDSKMSVSDFCSEKAARECGAPGSGGVADRCVVDANKDCKPVRTSVCMAWASAVKAESPTTRPYNGDRVDDCLNKTSEVYKKGVIVPADVQALQEICDRVFSGDKKNGDSCASTYECGGDLVCDQLVCAPKKTLVKADYCGKVAGTVCGPGLYCATPAGQTMNMCVDRKGAGAACDASDLCLETLRCVDGACVARVAVGQICESDEDCAPTAPYCDPYAFAGVKKCDAGFTPSPGTPECTTFGAAQ